MKKKKRKSILQNNKTFYSFIIFFLCNSVLAYALVVHWLCLLLFDPDYCLLTLLN